MNTEHQTLPACRKSALLATPWFQQSARGRVSREPEGLLSRYCHGSRGKTLENAEQKVNMEEKSALALDRNCLILLGKLPLWQIVIKLLKWLWPECS
jgi:hypothetical protein